MGNIISSGQPSADNIVKIPGLLDETQIFALWTIDDLKELLRRFKTQINGFALVETQFESLIAFKKLSGGSSNVPIETLFSILDNDHDGRIDGLELLGGLALCCNATLEEKARFVYELFDFDMNSVMKRTELIMLMMSSICGVIVLTGVGEDAEPSVAVFEQLADDCILYYDSNTDGKITFEEFLRWVRSNRDLMQAIELFSRISSQAKFEVNPEDSASETSDDFLSDADDLTRTTTGQALANKRIKKSTYNLSPSVAALVTACDESLLDAARPSWKDQVMEPNNRINGKQNGPSTNLELAWLYGYKSEACSDNVRYGRGKDPSKRYIVYYSAAVAVVFDPETSKQCFYLGHSEEITCINTHPNNQIIATADCKSNIHIWSLENALKSESGVVAALSCIKGMVKEGIIHIEFSPSGDRIASIGADKDHTISINDVNINSGEVISSTKTIRSPNTVYDIAFSVDGGELAVVGKGVILFCLAVNTKKRSISTCMGKIGRLGKRQTFFSVTYMHEDCIVGCASGEVYRLKDHVCISIIQAHGMKEPILSMFFDSVEGVLITGGKDGLIKTWDKSLIAVGQVVDLREDISPGADKKTSSRYLKTEIVSLQQWSDPTSKKASSEFPLLVSTRGSDIFEVYVSKSVVAPHSIHLIACGHYRGELWGLAVHPLREEFATCGDDKTLRIWSIKSHQQLDMRVMPDAARSIAYSPTGSVLCVGMVDGSMALIDCQSAALKVFSTWKHTEVIITDLKFSSDAVYLAAGSGDTNIYLYKSDDKRNYNRQAVCRGHVGSILHIDFSSNSRFIQSNGEDTNLFFWDVEGHRIVDKSVVRDLNWAAMTCTMSWSTQGIWSPGCSYSSINSCMALPDTGDVITGDDSHYVKLFNYPTMRPGSLHQKYIGHSSHVACVRFTYNRKYAISIGGSDRTILLWRHHVEDYLSVSEGSRDGSVSVVSSSSADEAAGGKLVSNGVDVKVEIADVEVRSLDQEAVMLGWSLQALKEYARTYNDQVYLNNPTFTDKTEVQSSVHPWKAKIVQPTDWKASDHGTTDIDLSLKWVHGHRSEDCRNNVFYSASGSIVYNAATLAVVYSKGAGKQQFLTATHSDEVVSIVRHPAGQLFATGDCGNKPSIAIWDSKDMQVLQRITSQEALVHEKGVPLLAFNTRGNILASVGLDSDHSLTLHDWSKAVEIIRTPTDKRKVLCVSFLLNDPTNAFDTSVAKGGGVASTGGVSDSRDIVVTAGIKHLKFWWYQGHNVQSQHAMWGKHRVAKRSTVMCVASANRDMCVSGSSDGDLIIWHKFRAVCNVRESMAIGAKTTMNSMKADTMKAGGFVQGDNTYPHLNNISTTTTTTSSSSSSQHGVCLQSIWAIPGYILEIESGMDNSYNQCFEKYSEASRYVTADKGGQIAIWRTVKIGDNYFLALIRTFHVSSLEPKPMDYSVRSVCVRDNMILIGLRSSEIFEVNENEVPNLVKKHNRYYSKHGLVSNSTKQVMISSTSNAALKKVIDKSLKAQRLNVGHGTGEVWGLAIHPILPVFLTTGDDCTLKCWSLASHKLLSYSRLPDKSRSVDIHPKDGAEFCLSLNSGELWILDMKQMLNPYHRANIPSLDPDLDGDDVTTESISNTESKLKLTEQDGKVSNEKTGKTFKRTILKSDGDPSKGPTSWVQVLRYSFEGSFLAAGSHDNRLYIYMKKASTDAYVLLTWLDHNRSFVTHLDFGVLLNNADTPFEVEKDKSTPTHRRSIRRQSIYDAHSGKVVNVTKHEKLDDNDKVVGTMIKMNRTTANASDVKPTDICIQSTNANSELFFWRCVMKGDSNYDIVPVESAASMKDAYWSTITCPYGWSVQGIWPLEQHNSIDILSVARSHSSNVVQVLATADNHGRLRMYNYPSTIPGDSDKCYRGHAHHITNVQFSRDDEYCISIGGTDKCVFVWKTDIPDEIRERLAYKSMKTLYSLEENDDDDDVDDDDDAIDDQFNLITDKVADENISNVVTFDYQMSMYELSRPSSNTASKQHQQAWKGIVKEPSNWKDPDGSHAEPDADLELKFVYGYRGWDCRNDVKIGTVGHDRFEVVYHVARVGIVLNCEDNTQIHNLEHDHDITCLAIHPPSCIVASGEIGMVPKIVLWDSNTGVTIRTILLHKNGVSNIAFSGSGLIIISTGLDQDRCVAAHSVSTGALLGKSKAGQGVEVFTLSVCGDELFMTGGKNHVKFWSLPNPKSPGGEFSSKCGIYSIAEIRSKTIVSSAFLGTDAVTGMSDGMIVLWKDRYTTKHCRAHYGPVTAMNSIDGDTGGIDTKEQGPRVVTAGDDGFVHTWDIQLHKMWTLDLNSTTPKSVNPQIQAVVVRENRLVLGTKASEIYEVSLLNNNDTYRIVQGHFSTREEVAGLAIHPRMNRFITCGDDCTVRLWDSKSKKLVEMMQLEARARAVAIRSDGSQVAVATHNGDLHVLTTDKLIWKLKVTVCSSCLQVLQYSPDSSKVLAVGSDDFTIYLLETNAYGTISILKGHNASVKAIDFSTDGKQLQSNSRDGELLFWDSKTGKQLSAAAVRDVEWSTGTCTLGWSMQGLWPHDTTNNSYAEVTAVDRSPDSKYILAGDMMSRVRLFRYPCLREMALYKQHRGHSADITCVKFSSDGKTCLTIGGVDKAILQYEVKKEAAKKSDM